MRLLRGLYNCPPELFEQGCVATIGNFDGVHLGHQAIIKRLTDKAAKFNLPSVVVVFEPHPQEYFRPDDAPARLFKLTDKVQALNRLGVDYVLCFRFNKEFAELSAEDFIRRVLIERLNVQHLFIGDDFKFGYQRKGDFDMLKERGEGAFTVEANHSVTLNVSGEEQRISSSLVRQAVAANEFELAERYLGRPYQIEGKVAHGDKQGREIGFSTANIPLKRHKSPLKGVYAVWVYGISASLLQGKAAKCWPAVANIGNKPTLQHSPERLEVHLLDFSDNLYGQRIIVEPIEKLRGEQKFESIDALKAQINADIDAAYIIFNETK
ncbi:bifunctional riboflavin kinase/FAD synthetase [Kangiella sediminilitoris]|uniref:Riboflavin biosynthesis protein n=1 Tax=Kangiella sediminilitoris TaxID=1144748 RepID=A0A1B3BBC6_9GAMM|nr:bifunctional riboflavin kinase/FAD synthetase [Kangiella sediminilitoris]AOE50101.1 FMN adenylyltransferase [Kangiella sediminilitoris]